MPGPSQRATPPPLEFPALGSVGLLLGAVRRRASPERARRGRREHRLQAHRAGLLLGEFGARASPSGFAGQAGGGVILRGRGGESWRSTKIGRAISTARRRRCVHVCVRRAFFDGGWSCQGHGPHALTTFFFCYQIHLNHHAKLFLPRAGAVKDAHLRAREGLSLTAPSTVGR